MSADPWVAVEATIRRSKKMTALPNDSARWGFIVALGECKLLYQSGGMTPGQWSEQMGRFARYLRDYIAVGLVHQAPFECADARCMRGRRPFPDGWLVIHDWPVYQREHSLRQRRYRDAQSDVRSDAPSDVRSDADDDALSRGRTGAVPVPPVHVSGQVSPLGEPYPVSADDPEGPVLSWLASQGVGIAPDGGGFHRKVVMLVERYGQQRTREALGRCIASGARGARAVVFGAENLLDPVPSANGAPKPRKGYMPRQEDLDALAG